MANAFQENGARAWRTDRMKLLDSRELINASVREQNGALPGTGKPSDGQRISDEIVQMLLAELKDDLGVQSETFLATLGALAGFSVQMALRETLVRPGKMPEDKVFAIVKTKAGETLYFGDYLNEGLFGSQSATISVYGLVAGGAQKAGAKAPPDAKDIAAHVASTVGSSQFGVPRGPAGAALPEKPVALLDRFWNPVRNHMALNVKEPLQWPMVLGLAAQKAIVMTKDAGDPTLSARLVLETAAALSKIDPATIHYAYFQSY